MSGLRSPKVEIISLIYRSTAYAAHIVSELAQTRSEKCDLSWRLVANDPTPEVADFLIKEKVCHTTYNDPKPDDYYLNRVYRAWNFAGETSKADWVCFVNSDMAFDHEGNWFDNLFLAREKFPQSIPCSLLIESGNLQSMEPAISYNCGRTLSTLDRKKFGELCRHLDNNIGWDYYDGGLFMPCILPQDLFDKNSPYCFPYPEGNIYKLGAGRTDSEFVMSGDAFYFRELDKAFDLHHITTSSSLVYHLQEGELKGRD